ncbi:uncharacterized protein LOC129409867 isoform X2 [Boleophthalmus pectinirostris]|uniref:uncharacterized protein LOC129409867 isoform X2 n=1 Tax=Boleophthalmus pectinirostris TaxID=150288 RepID=UPI00243161F1|nr:uncharacterized protein LOC129409867 isoform X2 [Boleophthalmus pectinirostris]
MDALGFWIFCVAFAGLEASPYMGMTMTYYPKETGTNTSHQIEMRYKITATYCDVHHFHCFSGDCGQQVAERYEFVDRSSSVLGQMCQYESVKTLQTQTNAPYRMRITDRADGFAFGTTIEVFTEVDLRTRSDTTRADHPPQGTIMSPVRVASNCVTEIRPLIFDPDGDRVVCRYGRAPYECDPCDQPPIFHFTPSCAFTVEPVNASSEGGYAVEMMLEDHPTRDIVLTQSNGTEEARNSSRHISSVPFQFVVLVLPALPSCTAGMFLPQFVDPTPAHGQWIYVEYPSHSQIFSVQANATNATVSSLLFSGPSGVYKTPEGDGLFTLHWNVKDTDDHETYPLCFVAEVLVDSVKYHSELRCVLLVVGDRNSHLYILFDFILFT